MWEVSVDARRRQTRAPGRDNTDEWEIYTHGGRNPTGLDAVEWAVECVRCGAGEVLLTSIDRDGARTRGDEGAAR